MRRRTTTRTFKSRLKRTRTKTLKRVAANPKKTHKPRAVKASKTILKRRPTPKKETGWWGRF